MKPVVLRVQTPARMVVARLYTRGRAPATWHYYFSFRGRFRGSTGHTDLKAAQAATIAAVHTAVETVARPQVLPLGPTVESYLMDRWPMHYRAPGAKSAPPADDPVEQGRYHTAKDHRSRLRAFATRVGPGLLLGTIEGDALTGLVHRYLHERLKDGMTPRTVHNDQIALSAFCGWLLATHSDRIPWRGNPACRKPLRLPKLPEHIPTLPTADELAAFLEATRPTPLWPIVVLILGADFRPRGALRVKWSDVDLAGRKVRAWEKGKQRIRPLPAWARKELAAWRRTHPADVTLWPYNLETAFDQVTRIPGSVTLQQLRQVASNRLIDGVDLRTYSAIAGHSLEVAQAHYLERKAAQATKALDRAMDFSALTRHNHARPHRRKHQSSTKSSTRIPHGKKTTA